jgi:hypothetical protein
MDQEFDSWLEKAKQERQEGINQAKVALFACLANTHPHIARITAFYSGSGDEGFVDELFYYDANDAAINLEDDALAALVEKLFFYVTPEGFEINDGGDGEIHVYPATQKVVVEHNQNVVHQVSETYEA